MITFEQFKQLMSFETEGTYCVEIAFSVKNSEKFSSCWMGKMPEEKSKADLYWFGLAEDGNNAFEYCTFEEFVSAKVFDGRSLFDIWDEVTISEIDGCDPEEQFLIYIEKNKRTKENNKK